MSIHKECGENIKWMRRADDTGWLPPLEYAGTVYVEIDGKGEEHHGYRQHRCDPDKMDAWIEYLRKKGEITGDMSELDSVNVRVSANERSAEAAREYAQHEHCPSCDANIGKPCVNLAAKKKGEVVEIKWPRPSRLERAGMK